MINREEAKRYSLIEGLYLSFHYALIKENIVEEAQFHVSECSVHSTMYPITMWNDGVI